MIHLLLVAFLLQTPPPKSAVAPTPTTPVPPTISTTSIVLPPDTATAVKQMIVRIVAISQKGFMCSVALHNAQTSLSDINKEIGDAQERQHVLQSQLTDVARRISRMSARAPEYNALAQERIKLIAESDTIAAMLRTRPASPLLARQASAQKQVDDNSQCVTKAQRDLDAVLTEPGLNKPPR